MPYAIGLDYGTNSCRAVLVDLGSGSEVADHVEPYPSGKDGVVVVEGQPDLARQHPADYLSGLERTIKGVLEQARARISDFSPELVIGVGTATTGSTPIPVDEHGTALALKPQFADRPAAMAWLWKDHTSHAEASAITRAARAHDPAYVDLCGGTYSSEWFWAKIWHCLREDREVFEAAYSWVELCDYLPAVLTGRVEPDRLVRSATAAGHKAMYAREWGGLPDAGFWRDLAPELADVRARLFEDVASSTERVGPVSDEWAERTGLAPATSVAVGNFDAHAGAVAGNVGAGVLVKVMGTSTCDLTVMPQQEDGLPRISGICGVADSSVLPGLVGVEAGQSAVGDFFRWFAQTLAAGEDLDEVFNRLVDEASELAPGAHGLVALDWINGNRTVLIDQRLSAAIVGVTLQTRPHHLYQAIVEATAFGARRIIDQFDRAGAVIERVVACGGLPQRNAALMQTYADVLGLPIAVAASPQASALGAAIFGAVAAGTDAGGFDDVRSAQEALVRLLDVVYQPDPAAVKVYDRLYTQWLALHDAFGGVVDSPLADTMKELLSIRDGADLSTDDAAPGEAPTPR